MYPVTHLVVHTINRNASPVTLASIRSPRRRRRADAASAGVAIRAARPDDAVALSTLAQVDSAPLAAERLSRLAADPAAGTVLVADVDGQPLAALDVDRDSAVADPFEPTASLVAMLRVRARQLAGSRSGAHRLPHIGIPHLRTP
jgi:hypothetical protein